MSTTDPAVRALAEGLHEHYGWDDPVSPIHLEAATAILAGLPDWTLVRREELERLRAALVAVNHADVREIEAEHVWIGPSFNSPDGLGSCSCGDDDCEIATLLDAIHRVRAALDAKP